VLLDFRNVAYHGGEGRESLLPPNCCVIKRTCSLNMWYHKFNSFLSGKWYVVYPPLLAHSLMPTSTKAKLEPYHPVLWCYFLVNKDVDSLAHLRLLNPSFPMSRALLPLRVARAETKSCRTALPPRHHRSGCWMPARPQWRWRRGSTLLSLSFPTTPVLSSYCSHGSDGLGHR
jgi:hypothetical protein